MTLKGLALGATAMLAASSALAGDLYFPPAAPPAGPIYQPPSLVSAHVELGAGALFASTHGLFEGAGRLALPLHGAWNLEAEIAANAIWEHEEGYTYSSQTVGAYVHAFHKSPQGALGGFVGVAFAGAPLFVIGAEGNWYINSFTVYAQASYNFAHHSGGSDESFPAARLGFWYYTNPNHKIGAYLAWQGRQHEYTSSYWEVAGAGEYRFANVPVSVYGRGGLVAGGLDTSDRAWYVIGGVRLFTDGPDLWTSDQNVPFSVKYIPQHYGAMQ